MLSAAFFQLFCIVTTSSLCVAEMQMFIYPVVNADADVYQIINMDRCLLSEKYGCRCLLLNGEYG